MEVWLPFNGTEVYARVPDERFVETVKRPEGETVNLRQAVKEALERVDDLRPNMGKRVAVAVRPSFEADALKATLTTLVDSLVNRGFSTEDIDVYFSQTLEAAAPPLDVGVGGFGRLLVHRAENQPFIEGPGGVRLNRMFMEADVKVILGVFEASYLSGYVGAPHSVYPGLTDLEAAAGHLDEGCQVKPGRVEEKALKTFRACVKICEELPVDLALNLVAYKGDVYGLFHGEVEETFNQAWAAYKRLFQKPLTGEPAIVLASAGGSPYDDRLAGLVQTASNAASALKKDGSVIAVCECGSWTMDKHGLEYLMEPKHDRGVEKVEDLAARGLAWTLNQLREELDLCLVSVIPNYYVRRGLKVRFSRTLNGALQTTMNRLKSGGIVAVEDGYHVQLKTDSNSQS
ncbi:MAG: hypothetical protein QXE22_05175 [Candidatus Bathyarchaeia archaeon]